jgi:hypothetical protein
MYHKIDSILFLYGLFKNVVSRWNYIALNSRKIGELWIVKDVEEVVVI